MYLAALCQKIRRHHIQDEIDAIEQSFDARPRESDTVGWDHYRGKLDGVNSLKMELNSPLELRREPI